VSTREGLVIMVGGDDAEATRVLALVGLIGRLPVFASQAAAKQALGIGRKPRPERPHDGSQTSSPPPRESRRKPVQMPQPGGSTRRKPLLV
jgi:hypothetical protein